MVSSQKVTIVIFVRQCLSDFIILIPIFGMTRYIYFRASWSIAFFDIPMLRRPNRDNSPLSERIATTVVAPQGEVDASPRSCSATSLATERSEVKVAVITAFSVTERILVVFVKEAKLP